MREFGLEPGVGAERGFGVGAEVAWASERTRRMRPVIPSYEPALLRRATARTAAWIQRQCAGLVLETEAAEMPEAEE